MFFGPRKLVAFVAIALVLIDPEGSLGQGNEMDSSDNKTNLVPTYRTFAEKAIQKVSESGDKLISSLVPETDTKSGENKTTTGFGDLLNRFEENFHAIFPGTLWCGGGNIARNESDVGLFNDTDSCCRDHDNCPSNIDAGDTLGPLYNNGAFTRSACSCDNEFHDCLKKVDTLISRNIGTTYFNILRPQCFAESYPIKSCAQRGKFSLINRRCRKYNFDKTGNKTLEWFDNRDF